MNNIKKCEEKFYISAIICLNKRLSDMEECIIRNTDNNQSELIKNMKETKHSTWWLINLLKDVMPFLKKEGL